MSYPQRQGGGQSDRFADYVSVAERISKFYEAHKTGRIVTAVEKIDLETGFVLMRAEVFRNLDDAQPGATGHAYEVRGESHVNKTSFVENCETSAVGRALALLGFEVKRGIASREEMEKTARMEGRQQGVEPQAAPVAPRTDEEKRLETELTETCIALGYDLSKRNKALMLFRNKPTIEAKRDALRTVKELLAEKHKEAAKAEATAGEPATGDEPPVKVGEIGHEERGRLIASQAGMIERDGADFHVVDREGERRTSYKVWRGAGGKVMCECATFKEGFERSAEFRCAHIFAVKFHVAERPAAEGR